MLRVLDLFSGIGGFTLGLERTGGFETVAFCEIADFPKRVIAKHWPDVPLHPDVRELRGDDVSEGPGDIKVICGGFPCQDISYAGTGAGINGPRSVVWREFARLIGELRPHYVIVENVAALLKRGLGVVLGDLVALGYDSEWHCVPAYYAGSPQPRDRVFIVAYPAGWFAEPLGTPSHFMGPKSRLLPARWYPDYDLTEPDVPRVGRGIPDRFHRISALGNAVVPQIPEIIGRAILEAEGLDDGRGTGAAPSEAQHTKDSYT